MEKLYLKNLLVKAGWAFWASGISLRSEIDFPHPKNYGVLGIIKQGNAPFNLLFFIEKLILIQLFF